MSETNLPADKDYLQAPITQITVGGFKTLREKQTVDIRPLTLLAGKNSAGKSSLLQPLLLLKQSLESAVMPPGGVLLNGPNVKFTSANQMLSRGPAGVNNEFCVVIGEGQSTLTYRKIDEHNIGIHQLESENYCVRHGMTRQELYEALIKMYHTLKKHPNAGPRIAKYGNEIPPEDAFPNMIIQRQRCFLEVDLGKKRGSSILGQMIDNIVVNKSASANDKLAMMLLSILTMSLEVEQTMLINMLTNIIHLPGLRGNPERQYPLTNWDDTFPGTFEKYAASVLHGWQERNQPEMLAEVEADLVDLDLAHKVRARAKDGTSVEVEIKPGSDSVEVVSLADVGLGVSQCLPVVVALHVAKPNQLVYLEQPEIHLHPRAQVKLASVLARAVRRGVRMIVETHSDHLLLGIQTLVGEGQLTPPDVGLNWFQHDAQQRSTRIHSADINEAGGFGDWPEDFSEVDMESRTAYLDAVAARRRKAAAVAT